MEKRREEIKRGSGVRRGGESDCTVVEVVGEGDLPPPSSVRGLKQPNNMAIYKVSNIKKTVKINDGRSLSDGWSTT